MSQNQNHLYLAMFEQTKKRFDSASLPSPQFNIRIFTQKE